MRNSEVRGSVWLVAALATMAGCARLQAQTALSLARGTRVRVVVPVFDSGGTVGIVSRLVGDTLTIRLLQRSETLIIVLSEETRLEVSTGHHTDALKGMGVGLFLGAAGGGIAGRASGDDKGWFGFTANEKAGLGAAFFGVVGALAGAAIGGNHEREGWTSVVLPPRSRIGAVPSGDHRVAIVYSVSF
ncbi:MAG TPA: hypothetical protein VJO33_15445 [Gemmatimonadaceae bacterium]|nr:hypothetical protein [Gemmatimonadaceae bacterium]